MATININGHPQPTVLRIATILRKYKNHIVGFCMVIIGFGVTVGLFIVEKKWLWSDLWWSPLIFLLSLPAIGVIVLPIERLITFYIWVADQWVEWAEKKPHLPRKITPTPFINMREQEQGFMLRSINWLQRYHPILTQIWLYGLCSMVAFDVFNFHDWRYWLIAPIVICIMVPIIALVELPLSLVIQVVLVYLKRFFSPHFE